MRLLLHFVLALLLITTSVFAEDEAIQQIEELKESLILINEEIEEIEDEIGDKNIWIKRFQVKNELQDIKKKQYALELKIKKLWKKRDKKSRSTLAEHLEQKEVLKSQLQLLEEFADKGYDSLHEIHEPTQPPTVTNPFSIIVALSYIKEIKGKKLEYTDKLENLRKTIGLLKEKENLLIQKNEIIKLLNDKKRVKKIKNKINKVHSMILDFKPEYQLFSTSLSIFNKKTAEIEQELNVKIKNQTVRLMNVFIVIVIFIGFVFLIKMVLKRYLTDPDRFYITNRTINIVTVLIVLLIIAFNYINNLTYILTILGFVSAGIAFAMKEWFMSILGWFVIVLGGYIHVGDRIRIYKDNEELVGDVLEISFTRITIYEDVALPTYMKNRRAGRVIFMPNNYIFTYMIQNYTFGGLKTVWDGIDIMLTFTSNHKKAVHIAREITTKYSKGYSDLTRKQMNNLRAKYNIKNSSVEPRIFTMIEKYGMNLSMWYLTNSYATLALRSRISAEIVEAFNAEDDIEIAYPTQTIKFTKDISEVDKIALMEKLENDSITKN